MFHRWASEEETEIAFRALETERPHDLQLFYDAMHREGEEEGAKVYFDHDMPSLLKFLGSLPIRPDAADRLRVAGDLYYQIVDDVKYSFGPRGWKG